LQKKNEADEHNNYEHNKAMTCLGGHKLNRGGLYERVTLFDV